MNPPRRNKLWLDSKTGTLYEVCEIIANTTDVLPPDMVEWPSHMFDKMAATIERIEKLHGLKYEIMNVITGKDVDTGPYVHLVLRAPLSDEERLRYTPAGGNA